MDDYYLFLDESGDHGLSSINPQSPIFLLCGVLIGAGEYQDFRHRLNEIKEQYWGNKEVHFHSRDIRKSQKDFQILLDKDVKDKFYADLNMVIADSKFTIICAAINKPEYARLNGLLLDDVYEQCLSFIIERTVFCMDDIKGSLKRVSIIIEKRGKKEDRKLHEHFQRLLSRGTGYVNSDRLKSYGMSIHFRSKADNVNGLQLSDLVAYPTTTHIQYPERDNLAFDVFSEKFYCKNGNRYGLKIYP